MNGASRAARTPQASSQLGDMPGKKSFPRNSADSYTTDKHVFKPPKDGETISQDRADRWQNASAQSWQTKSSSGTTGTLRLPTSPKTVKQVKKKPEVRLPEPEIVAPVAAPMAHDGLNLKKVKPPVELQDDWYPVDPLNPEPGRHGPYDMMGVRPGMSHPPQNPKVRKQLLAYLYAREVPHTIERRTIKSPKRSQNESLSSSMLEEDELQGSKTGSMQASGPATGTSTQGLGKSTSMPNLKGDWSGHDGQGRARNKTTQAAGSSGNRMESLQQERKTRPPPSLGEDEVQRKSEDLRLHSRFHGFDLGKKEAKDLAQLSIYHNEVTRRHFPNHVKQQHQGATPGQKLRELRSFFIDQAERQDDGRSTDWDDKWSLGAASDTKLVRPMYFEDYGPLGVGPSPGQASPSRIKKLAEEMEPVLERFCSSGTRTREGRPNRLQAMSRATGMNVITGAMRQEPLC